MIKVYISNETHELVQSRAIHPFKGGKQLSSGEWEIELEQDTIDAIMARALPGENISQAIYRLLSRVQ